MRFPFAALAPVVVALAAPSCAARNHHPATLYGLDLKQPHAFKQPTGTTVSCGKGVAWLFRDVLWTCALDQRTTIEGYALPAGATLWFRGDGTLEKAVSYSGDPRVRRVVMFDDWEDEIVSSTVEPD